MANKPVVYPYGFMATRPTGVRPMGRTEGDQEVAEVYTAYFRQDAISKSWELKVSTMVAALRLFGPSFYDWALQQLDNEYLNNKAIRFIADTVKFIEYGSRDMPALLWSDILDSVPVADKVPSTVLRTELRAVLTALRNNSDPQYLYKWLQQPNGFEDLLACLSICFGPDRRPEDQKLIVNQSPKNPQMQRLQKLLNF